MMTLAEQQSRFILGLMSDTAALPERWQRRERAGYAIYRNAYRARLIDALRETFPRTAQLAGEEAFQAAAAHHLITHPPASWTLDDAGRGFTETLKTLFPGDPDVAELGWVEWAMRVAFTVSEAAPLDGRGMLAATASFNDEGWQNLRLRFVPGLDARLVQHDIPALWRLLEEDIPAARNLAPLRDARGCVVWREGLRPTFTAMGTAETEALIMMKDGATYGAACDQLIGQLGEQPALALAGEMLAYWLASGWIEAIRR